MQWGYCTNVHAGADLEQTRRNLAHFAVAVKRLASPTSPMGIGLWLSASTARKLLASDELDAFSDWLNECGLVPFTLNGFPYGDFHQEVVKHKVYDPAWIDDSRVDFTLDLILIMDRLLPPGITGSISTSPLAWGAPGFTDAQFSKAASNLHRAARALKKLEEERGRKIVLSIEPEPGCVLQRSRDLTEFFESYLLLPGQDGANAARYLGVCHDICHAEVMFESQKDVLDRYRASGISIGKVQVSSAAVLDLSRANESESQAGLAQLRAFVEDRYLHQTVVRASPGATPEFYEDLPAALARARPLGEWRVHFHVPVYLARFGHVTTSRAAIQECVAWCRSHEATDHFEVETYAWSVLPPELQEPDLASGIAKELAWFEREYIRPPSASANEGS